MNIRFICSLRSFFRFLVEHGVHVNQQNKVGKKGNMKKTGLRLTVTQFVFDCWIWFHSVSENIDWDLIFPSKGGRWWFFVYKKMTSVFDEL